MKHFRFLPIAFALLASSSFASPTAPDLEIRSASLLEVGAIRQLSLVGSFHYDDLVQVAYPFQLVVYTESGHFVLYDLSGGTYTGEDPGIGDGIDLHDAQRLLRHRGRKADAGVVSMTPDALGLRLPATLPRESLTVQIFVEDQGRIVFSNTRRVVEEFSR